MRLESIKRQRVLTARYGNLRRKINIQLQCDIIKERYI